MSNDTDTIEDLQARIRAILINAREQRCPACGITVYMIKNKYGWARRYTLDGKNHINECKGKAG